MSRNPTAVLLVVDVGRFPAENMPVGMLLLPWDIHNKSFLSPLALLADVLFFSIFATEEPAVLT